MARYATALLILLLALAGLTGCHPYGVYGGYNTYYAPQYVCYDVLDGYYWDGYRWIPVYTTVCQWESLTPQEVGDQEIAGVYASEGNVLTRASGAALAVGQLIELQPVEGEPSFILVKGVSEPKVREGAEASEVPSSVTR